MIDQTETVLPILRLATDSFALYKPGYEKHQQTARFVLPEKVNYELISGWLSICQDSHVSDCNKSQVGYQPGMKLIDCHAGRVIVLPALRCDYVVLSHVWGGTASTPVFCDTLPRTLPKTIEDSITVTFASSFRYIWIDQYVGNLHKHKQVKLNDIISASTRTTRLRSRHKSRSWARSTTTRNCASSLQRVQTVPTVYLVSMT